ncbi:hypothetical protein CYY_010141 [Polysphondylium violaceum]|uniref:Uncharacterized protein n=1 Tax=Polysphondylium violaceum TaxID=133409 RepID=A0A8J4PS64_9MYCE|nr:hypothetical protein CYY_010141 [Polysphondylium violaceum]
MAAIKRLEIDKVKSILLGVGKKDKEKLLFYTFNLYYNTLAKAKTFQEKKDLIELGKFLKSEFLKSDLVNHYFDIPLAFILDKEFYLKLQKNQLNHASLVKGPLMTDEFGLLKYFVEVVGPDLILSIDVENIILEFALFTSGETLKPVLYLFEKWQHLIKSESILDHLMHMAVKNDNHRLINILLHRTKIRLIKPVSPQHEHQILSRMKLVLKSSRFLRPTYFQKYPNFEIDEPLLDQHIMEALGNPIDRIGYKSSEFSNSDNKTILFKCENGVPHLNQPGWRVSTDP